MSITMSGGMTFTGAFTVAPAPPNIRAIFAFGDSWGTPVSISNIVSNTGVVASDTTNASITGNRLLAGAGYGSSGQAIFGYGFGDNSVQMSKTNLVTNTGVIGNYVTGVGTQRYYLAAAGYGTDKAIFGYGSPGGGTTAVTNKVSNAGVVATDTTGVGTARYGLAAAGYGSDKAIFGYGMNGSSTVVSMTNLVSNTGVVSSDVTGVGSPRYGLAAAGYGTDKAIFGYGWKWPSPFIYYSTTNLVSNTGVVATDTAGVGTVRNGLAAAGYGSTGQAIFGYGNNSAGVYLSMTNLVSNTGVVANDTTGVGTVRQDLGATTFGP